MDNHSVEERSYNMSRIQSKGTKPEEMVRKYLFSQGFRYRKNVKGLPGKPDIVFPKYKTVVFVNGCFWHGHKGCKGFVPPKSNQDYWIPKIERNRNRDIEVQSELSTLGWKVIVVWECQLKKGKREESLIHLVNEIKKNLIDKN